MIKLLRVVSLASLFYLIIFNNVFAACTVTDSTGETIKLTWPAQRVISLAPNITEILMASGVGSKLVGVDENSDTPLLKNKLPVVASYQRLNVEKIVQLHPDIIFAWQGGNPSDELALLKRIGIRIYFFKAEKLKDITTMIQHAGCLLGTEKQADKAAKAFESELNQLAKQVPKHKPIPVFYELWSNPLLTTGGVGIINQIITLCGGQNVFVNIQKPSIRVGLEAVLQREPHVIFSVVPKPVTRWHTWSDLPAVEHKAVFYINPSDIERFSPRILTGAKQICRDIGLSIRK